MWFAVVVLGLYGYLFFIALSNWLLMRRTPKSSKTEPLFCVLIPARNEEENLRRLLPPLVEQGVSVYVFDDESEDRTSEIAARYGAKVVRPREPLPEGWTGKNRACHELAKVAAEDSPHEWYLFLDADTVPTSEFASRINGLIETVGTRVKTISGFPRMLPGKGVEPLYLSWVPWILLSASPFGLVARTRLGHPKFTNGQFGLWNSTTYFEVMPHETVRDRVLEDVLIGRTMANLGRRIEIVNLTQTVSVEMYRDFREALDGMSKNTYQITGSTVGVFLMAFGFLLAGWGWAFLIGPWNWIGLATLLVCKFVTDRTVKSVWWTFPFAPITCTFAAYTCLRSWLWHRRGATVWKGRVYRT